MIKHATAIRQETASTEAILRRFTRSAFNRHDEQQTTVLCLRILQAALVYVNALMLQDVLAEDGMALSCEGSYQDVLSQLTDGLAWPSTARVSTLPTRARTPGSSDGPE